MSFGIPYWAWVEPGFTHVRCPYPGCGVEIRQWTTKLSPEVYAHWATHTAKSSEEVA